MWLLLSRSIFLFIILFSFLHCGENQKNYPAEILNHIHQYGKKVPSLEIDSVFPQGKIDQPSFLLINFSQPMMANDALAFNPEKYIEIKPYTPGVFEWINSKTLKFEPKKNFLSGIRYEITIKKTISSIYHQTLKKDFSWFFEIADLKLLSIWPSNGSYFDLTEPAEIHLVFNQNVELNQIRSLIELSIEEIELKRLKEKKNIPFELSYPEYLGNLVNNEVILTPKISEIPPQARISFILKKNSTSNDSEDNSTNFYHYFYSLPQLEIIKLGCRQLCNPQDPIEIYFSKPVEPLEVINKISLNSDLISKNSNYQYFPDDNLLKLHVELDPKTSYQLKLFDEDKEFEFTTSPFKPDILFDDHYYFLDFDKNPKIFFKVRNIKNPQVKISSIRLDSLKNLINQDFDSLLQQNSFLKNTIHEYQVEVDNYQSDQYNLVEFDLTKIKSPAKYFLLEVANSFHQDKKMDHEIILIGRANFSVNYQFYSHQLWVGVNSFADQTPRGGVIIDLLDENGLSLARGETAATGDYVFNTELVDQVKWLQAKSVKDEVLIPVNQDQIKLTTDQKQLYLSTDRKIYHSLDEISISGLLNLTKEKNIPNGRLVLLDEDKNEVWKIKIILNSSGFFEVMDYFPRNLKEGKYTFALYHQTNRYDSDHSIFIDNQSFSNQFDIKKKNLKDQRKYFLPEIVFTKNEKDEKESQLDWYLSIDQFEFYDQNFSDYQFSPNFNLIKINQFSKKLDQGKLNFAEKRNYLPNPFFKKLGFFDYQYIYQLNNQNEIFLTEEADRQKIGLKFEKNIIQLGESIHLQAVVIDNDFNPLINDHLKFFLEPIDIVKWQEMSSYQELEEELMKLNPEHLVCDLKIVEIPTECRMTPQTKGWYKILVLNEDLRIFKPTAMFIYVKEGSDDEISYPHIFTSYKNISDSREIEFTIFNPNHYQGIWVIYQDERGVKSKYFKLNHSINEVRMKDLSLENYREFDFIFLDQNAKVVDRYFRVIPRINQKQDFDLKIKTEILEFLPQQNIKINFKLDFANYLSFFNDAKLLVYSEYEDKIKTHFDQLSFNNDQQFLSQLYHSSYLPTQAQITLNDSDNFDLLFKAPYQLGQFHAYLIAKINDQFFIKKFIFTIHDQIELIPNLPNFIRTFDTVFTKFKLSYYGDEGKIVTTEFNDNDHKQFKTEDLKPFSTHYLDFSWYFDSTDSFKANINVQHDKNQFYYDIQSPINLDQNQKEYIYSGIIKNNDLQEINIHQNLKDFSQVEVSLSYYPYQRMIDLLREAMKFPGYYLEDILYQESFNLIHPIIREVFSNYFDENLLNDDNLINQLNHLVESITEFKIRSWVELLANVSRIFKRADDLNIRFDESLKLIISTEMVKAFQKSSDINEKAMLASHFHFIGYQDHNWTNYLLTYWDQLNLSNKLDAVEYLWTVKVDAELLQPKIDLIIEKISKSLKFGFEFIEEDFDNQSKKVFQARAMQVLLKIDPKSELIEKLISELMIEDQKPWHLPKENLELIWALSDYSARQFKDKVDLKILMQDEKEAYLEYYFDNDSPVIANENLAIKDIHHHKILLRSEGEGRVFYQLKFLTNQPDYFNDFKTSSIFNQLGVFSRIRREHRVDIDYFHLNEEVWIDYYLIVNEDQKDILWVDQFPTGFIPKNLTLNQLKENYSAHHQIYQDAIPYVGNFKLENNRLSMIFPKLPQGVYFLSYQARLITPGKLIKPPSYLGSMIDSGHFFVEKPYFFLVR